MERTHVYSPVARAELESSEVKLRQWEKVS